MSSGKKFNLLSSQVISSDTTTNGDSVHLLDTDKQLVAVLKISARTDGAYVLTLQESSDGSNWSTLKTGSSITAVGHTTVKPTAGEGNLKYIRASIASSSTTSGATMSAELYTENRD